MRKLPFIIRSQIICYLSHKYVTGIGNARYHIHISVTRTQPTVGTIWNFIKLTITQNRISVCNNAFFHTCHCSYHLKGRTRRSKLLCGFIIKWSGQILIQLCKIICIHIISQTVIIISWISNTGKSFSCIYICNNHRP